MLGKVVRVWLWFGTAVTLVIVGSGALFTAEELLWAIRGTDAVDWETLASGAFGWLAMLVAACLAWQPRRSPSAVGLLIALPICCYVAVVISGGIRGDGWSLLPYRTYETSTLSMP